MAISRGPKPASSNAASAGLGRAKVKRTANGARIERIARIIAFARAGMITGS